MDINMHKINIDDLKENLKINEMDGASNDEVIKTLIAKNSFEELQRGYKLSTIKTDPILTDANISVIQLVINGIILFSPVAAISLSPVVKAIWFSNSPLSDAFVHTFGAIAGILFVFLVGWIIWAIYDNKKRTSIRILSKLIEVAIEDKKILLSMSRYLYKIDQLINYLDDNTNISRELICLKCKIKTLKNKENIEIEDYENLLKELNSIQERLLVKKLNGVITKTEGLLADYISKLIENLKLFQIKI